MATVMVNLLGLSEKPAENPYADLTGSEWYADAVLKCTAAGVMQGDGSNCNANANITRQEATVMFARALGVEEDASPNLSKFSDGGDVAGWAAGAVSAMADRGIITGAGDGRVLPNQNIDRASTMALLDKAISTYADKAGSYEATEDGITLVKAGDVTISGSADTILLAAGAADTTATLASDTYADTVILMGGNETLVLSTGANVGKVEVREAASGASVKVNSGSAVASMEIAGDNCSVTGSGKVGEIVVTGGEGSSVTVPGAKVKNESGSTVKVGNKDLAPGNEATVPGSGGSSGGTGPVEPTDEPTSIRLTLPENAEMVVDESRSIGFVILPETNFHRSVTWSSSDDAVATVDKWGRVTAHKAGTVSITARSEYNPNISDTVSIKIVASEDELAQSTPSGIVNFNGTPAEEVQNLQKYVDRYTKDEALASEDVPQTVKDALNNGTGSTAAVTQGDVTWSLEVYGIKRVETEPVHERDAEQYFMGDRYLPADAKDTPNTSIIHMESDNANGLWVASASAVTHIRMEELSYTDKAAEMSATSQEVSRYGFVSGTRRDDANSPWEADDDDNDGLWTSMYGVGELMRYAVLREDGSGATDDEVQTARDAALRSLKAVLLLSNVSCRQGTVEAFVRPLRNGSNWYLNKALLKGGDPSVRNLQHSPADTTARNDDESLMAPVVEEDWADLTLENFTGPKDAFETRTRSLEGFVARTLTVGDENYGGGNRWKINEDGTATCVMQDTTDGLPKYDSSTVDASGEIPEILLSVLPEGTVKSDITYKADTSTDELIGHLFIYKVAYDILDESNPEEAQLKALVSDTMDRLAQHFVDNGYSLRDATGQGTSWGKTELDYFNNGMTWEDSPLNCLVLLNIFKVASYVTGEQRWEDEYRMLATEEPYRYADLCGTYWERLLYVAQTDGVLQPGETPDHWALNYLNYSDEEMAMLAYYLLFQLEDDSVLLDKYRVGLNDWWNSMQYSENPLWYYIYQLAYPDEVKTDYFGNSLIETASWTLSRHPIDTIKWTASHPERPDVTGPVSSFLPDEELANGPTLDKETGEIRVAPFDERAVHKYNGNTYKLYDDNSNAMETSTTYTLPYWLGRYHGMIAPEATTDGPTSINLSLPENAEMVVDESRSIGFTILPESNLHRGVAWSSSDEEIATVDEWGRVTAHKAGTVTITATSTYNPAVSDTAAIKVVNTTDELTKSTPHEIVNYEGTAAEEVHNLQKYVDRYTKDEALASEDVPQTVKDALNNGTGSTSDVTQDDVTWSLEIYGIKRVETEPVHERDAEQYFMGNRYLPDDAKDTPNTSIIHMEGDTAGTGLWVVSAGAVTHIRMEELSYIDKAADMSATTQEYVARRGMVSEAVWNGEKWVPQETDNDGLWTSMYGAGELMRYKVLQDEGVQGAELEAAKKAALDSIKATLLLSNITCRTGTVEAYVRPLMNSTNQCHYTEQGKGLALLKDKEYAVYDRQGSPADTQVRNDDPNFLTPIVPEDWAIVDENSDKSLFATRTRSLDGMIARTYRLEGEYPDANFNDGYYWNIDGQIAKCEETTSTKVKWENLAGTTVDASGEIPEVLADLLGDATKDDIIYKTDTSTDEIIGHLFIYKIAYDILGDEGEEGQLKELISDTMRRIAQHFADNGYSLLDATGQGTTWGKTNLDYFNNGMTWEDNSLNCLVVLNIFKLAAYVTGEQRWEDEYQMLATEEPFRYADLCGKYWEHLAYVAHKNGFVPEDASEEEVNNWILNYLNYSDEEMAMLAYYLLFQMEDDSILLDKYREGLNDWWNSIQHSENPLWYYIYQLAYPSESKTDYYGNSLVETASWTLSRHPIDTIKWSATHPERPDVKAPDPTQYQGSPDDEIEFLNRGPTRDKTTGEIRVAPFDERGLHKYNGSTYGLEDINPNQMEGSTTYTLPYWLGRYHGMITPEATTDGPTSINLSLPENTEMVVGDNRSIDLTILPESNPYRGVTWTSDNEEVATVDKWGRVTAHKAGTVTITAAAKANPQVTASGTIKVVASLEDLSKTSRKDIVNYEGTPAEEVHNLQKYVDRYTKDEALSSEEVPQTVKNVLTDGSGASTAAVTQGDVTWSLETYGIKRLETEPVHERDAEQYFMGNRYLPDEAKETPATSIIHMESDTAGTGLWVVSANAVTHIRMEELSYTEKATEMSNNTHTYLDRYGFISESLYKDGKWVPQETDNDGTWTAKYAIGELMRYAVLKQEGADQENIATAREYALRSLKAALLLANISCRTGTVDAYVRPLQNDSNQCWYADNFTGYALLKGKDFSINNSQTSPANKATRIDGDQQLTPFFPEDWGLVTESTDKSLFETRTRTLEGFIARTFRFEGEFDNNFNDGYYWNITGDTATCEETTSDKVKWEKLAGTTVDASGEIPTVLQDLLGDKTKDDIIYKADTSTDEIINHLLVYKVAYDILSDDDPEEKAIKEVLVDTVRNIAQHFVDNGYALRDATGQGTTWGKTELDYFNNSMTWEDCSLNCLVLLNVFKLAGYVTGEARWENEYRMLATEEPYRYADLCGQYWERLEYVAHVDGGLPEDASQEEVDEWIRYYLCYPDEEMAVSAYYLLFQMEEDEALLEKYRAGFDDWWKSMQYSENPMYYYMYQLSFPNEEQTDAYGRSIVESASWELSREPIDTIAWSAHHEDRPDVYADDGGYGWEAISRDRETNEIRVVPADERGIHKFDNSTYNLNHKNNPQLMEGCTNFTMPYWIGRYHGLITPEAEDTSIRMSSTEITHCSPDGINTSEPVKWTTSDPYVAYVDMVGNEPGDYSGKIIAISAGTAIITATQGDVTVDIPVSVTEGEETELKKLVYYYNAGDAQIPEALKTAEVIPFEEQPTVPAETGRVGMPSAEYIGYVEGENGVQWMLSADKKSVTLYDPNLPAADQLQYLEGGRYLPQDAAGQTQLISNIMSDGENGLWILGASGDATRVSRKQVSQVGIAMLEQEMMKNLNDRFGITSNDTDTDSKENKIAAIMGSKDKSDLNFHVEVGDNDGSITATFGRGQIYYYKYMLSKYGPDDERTKDALRSAIRTTEATALLPYVSGRQMKVPAKEEAKDYILELLGAAPDGSDEGKPVYLDEDGNYTLEDTGVPAPDGFLVRTFTVLPDGEGVDTLGDDAFLQKNAGVTTDINGKEVPYSKLVNLKVSSEAEERNQYSALKAYATVAVPDRLEKLYNPDGTIPESAVYYKDSTSTDELNNVISFYTLAYDTFRDVDPELASLLKSAIVSIANHCIINNYHIAGISANKSRNLYPDYQRGGEKFSEGFVDSGNGLNVPNYHTRWGNMEPEYLDGVNDPNGESDYEDGPLNNAIALEILQLAMLVVNDTEIPYYNDGEFKTAAPIDYAAEFKALTTPELFKERYPRVVNSTSALDAMQQYMPRYFAISEHNGDDFGSAGCSFEAYLNTGDEHKFINIMFSLVNTMPEDASADVLDAYKTAFDQWWYNVKRYRDPWATYYHALILAKFKELGVDVSRDEVDIAGAEHSLSRFPTNGGHWDVDNSARQDVTYLIYGDSTGWLDQALPRDEMRSYTVGEDLFDPNGSGRLSLYNQIAFILPVWLSRVPENIALIESLGDNARPDNGPAPSISDAESSSTDVYLTMNVGEQKTLNVTGTEDAYVRNIVWNTATWTEETQIIDLKNLYSYEALTQDQFFPAQVTAVHPGTTTVTALTCDGFSPRPNYVTYHITVEDPKESAPAQSLLTVSDSDFAYPSWLLAAINDEHKNTEGHCNVSIEYLSSNESAGTVDPESGAITYLTEEPFFIIAKVQYSDMTVNGEARFEKSHIMYFKTPVVKAASLAEF